MFSQASVVLFMGVCGRHPLGWHPPPQQTATAADGTHPTGMHSCYTEDSLNLQPRRPWETRHIWITDQSLLDGETLWMLTVYSKVNLSCGSIEGSLSDSVKNLVNSFQVDMSIVHVMYLINRKLVESTVLKNNFSHNCRFGVYALPACIVTRMLLAD